jgi:hypothetical protein
MFKGPDSYYGGIWNHSFDSAFFTTVRKIDYSAWLVTRTATGTAGDTPANSPGTYSRSVVGIAVAGTTGENFFESWTRTGASANPASFNTYGGFALPEPDNLLVVVKAGSALSYDGFGTVTTTILPTTPTSLVKRVDLAPSNVYSDPNYGDQQTASLFTRQLSTTANPGLIASTFTSDAAYGAYTTSHMAILIKGTPDVQPFNIGTSGQMAY